MIIETINTYDPKKRRPVKAGVIVKREDGLVFLKEVYYSKHLIWNSNCYAIQADVVENLKSRGITIVVIKELDTKRTFESNLDEWTRKQDLGHGIQYWGSRNKMREVTK